MSGDLANVTARHPGAIVSFESNHGPLRFSCDRFDAWRGHGWRANVRAIALGLEALRKVDRYGIGTGAEQYRGFGALPPATPMGAAMTAETAAAFVAEAACDLDAYDLLLAGEPEVIRGCYRRAAAVLHPDTGGDADEFRRLIEARDLLLSMGSPSPT